MFKKLISVLLCLLLSFSLFSSALTVIAEETENTETNTNTDTNTDTENTEPEVQEPVTITVGVITEPGTNKTGVNLRADAGSLASIAKIYLLQDGTNVTVNGTKEDVEGKINPSTQKPYVWYNVTYATYTGYVREDMITVTTHTIIPPKPEEEEEIVVKPFEEQLAEFPENYRPYLTALHKNIQIGFLPQMKFRLHIKKR